MPIGVYKTSCILLFLDIINVHMFVKFLKSYSENDSSCVMSRCSHNNNKVLSFHLYSFYDCIKYFWDPGVEEGELQVLKLPDLTSVN